MTQAPLHSFSLSGGGAARALAARARRAALEVVGLCHMEGHCSRKKPPSFGAWPCFDMPTVALKAKQAPRLA